MRRKREKARESKGTREGEVASDGHSLGYPKTPVHHRGQSNPSPLHQRVAVTMAPEALGSCPSWGLAEIGGRFWRHPPALTCSDPTQKSLTLSRSLQSDEQQATPFLIYPHSDYSSTFFLQRCPSPLSLSPGHREDRKATPSESIIYFSTEV